MYLTIPLFLFSHVFIVAVFLGLILKKVLNVPLADVGDFLIYDRRTIKNLNLFDKVNCIFCAWANGLIHYIIDCLDTWENYQREQSRAGIKIARKKNILIKSYFVLSLPLLLMILMYTKYVARAISYLLEFKQLTGSQAAGELKRKKYGSHGDEYIGKNLFFYRFLFTIVRSDLANIESGWCPIKHLQRKSKCIPAHHETFFERDAMPEMLEYIIKNGQVNNKLYLKELSVEKQNMVLKVAVIGDSIANGVAANTVVGGNGWSLMVKHLLVLGFIVANTFYAKLVKFALSKKRFDLWKKDNLSAIIEFMDRVLADPHYSWLIGSKKWCLLPRLERLFKCKVELQSDCKLGNSWSKYLNGDIPLPADKDIIIIHLGVNEFFEGRYFDSPEEFVNNIRESVLEKLIKLNPRALIYLVHVQNLNYLLTDPANEYTKTYRLLKIFGPSVGWYHRNFWRWSALGCKVSNKTDRLSGFFQGRLLSHARYHQALKGQCDDLNQRYDGQIRTLDELFTYDWYHSINDRLLSADGSHPSKNAHRLGAYHFARIIAKEYAALREIASPSHDVVPMLDIKKEFLTRVSAMIPAKQKINLLSALMIPLAKQFRPCITAWNHKETSIDFCPKDIAFEKIRKFTALSGVVLADQTAHGELSQIPVLNNNLINGFYLGALVFSAENLLMNWVNHLQNKYAVAVTIKNVDFKFHKIARRKIKFKLKAENMEIESILQNDAGINGPATQKVSIAILDHKEKALLALFTVDIEIAHSSSAQRGELSSNQQGFCATSCDIVAVTQLWYFLEKYGHMAHFSFVSLKGSVAAGVCFDKMEKITAVTSAEPIERTVHDAIFNAYEEQFIDQPLFLNSTDEGLKQHYGRIRLSSPTNRFVDIPIVFKKDGKVVANYDLTLAIKRTKESLY